MRSRFAQPSAFESQLVDSETTPGRPTIGWRSDIEKVSIEKLREFYDTFYWPNNATVTVIGDFKPDVALRLIGRYFGAITRSPKPIPPVLMLPSCSHNRGKYITQLATTTAISSVI